MEYNVLTTSVHTHPPIIRVVVRLHWQSLDTPKRYVLCDSFLVYLIAISSLGVRIVVVMRKPSFLFWILLYTLIEL